MLEQFHAEGLTTAPLERPLGRGVNFLMEVLDLNPILDQLLKADYPLFRTPFDAWREAEPGFEEGQREVLLQDPDGYLLRLVQILGRSETAR